MKLIETLKGVVAANAVFKTVAFILTLSLFIWVRDDRQASVVAFAPVRIVIPEGMELVSPPIDRVRLTVQGRWSDINGFDPTSVEPVQIEASRESDQVIPITSDMVSLPGGLRTTSIQPDALKVELEVQESKSVTIEPRIVGEPRENYRIGEPKTSPGSVELRGPASAISKMRSVATEPIDVSGQTQTIERQVQLRLDNSFVSYNRDIPITVTVPIETLEVQRTVQNIPIVVVNSRQPMTTKPAEISVTVRGPKAVVDELNSEDLHASIDMSGIKESGEQLFERQPVVKNLPPDIRLVDYHPKDVVVSANREEPSP